MGLQRVCKRGRAVSLIDEVGEVMPSLKHDHLREFKMSANEETD